MQILLSVVIYLLWLGVFMIGWVFVLALPGTTGNAIKIACLLAAIAYALSTHLKLEK